MLLLLLVTLVIPGSEIEGVCGTADQVGSEEGVRGGGGAKGKSQQETKNMCSPAMASAAAKQGGGRGGGGGKDCLMSEIEGRHRVGGGVGLGGLGEMVARSRANDERNCLMRIDRRAVPGETPRVDRESRAMGGLN